MNIEYAEDWLLCLIEEQIIKQRSELGIERDTDCWEMRRTDIRSTSPSWHYLRVFHESNFFHESFYSKIWGLHSRLPCIFYESIHDCRIPRKYLVHFEHKAFFN
ncbi:hypothetical protein BV326_04393 [Pseudomonas syringae pv. actinidiae]|nr:hypothetical protein BV326_04393 [Pseudomonas syringae pv. actinidiae]